MTRENKLAMVVGFGLLLFVGILVSDHFSAAQRQDTANLSLAERGRDRTSRAISIEPMPAAIASTLQPEQMPATSGDVQPSRGVTPIPSQPIEARGTTAVVSAPTASPVAQPKTQESAPGVRLHPIAEGETLYAICKKEYGDGSLSTALAAFNKKAIPDPRRIRKCVTIRIPAAHVLRGESAPARVEAAQGTTGAGSNAVSPPVLSVADVILSEHASSTGGVVTIDVPASSTASAKGKSASTKTESRGDYTVQKGDTLASIAKRKLGSTSRWQEIASLNSAELPDPAALSPGMTLKLPGRR